MEKDPIYIQFVCYLKIQVLINTLVKLHSPRERKKNTVIKQMTWTILMKCNNERISMTHGNVDMKKKNVCVHAKNVR